MFRRIAFLSAALMVSAGTATSLAQDSKPAPATKEAAQPKAEMKKIGIGDKAPDLKISKWVKGEPVTEFRRDHVYVVEFWATWCGPCIAGMPHVSEVQKKFAEKNVRVIGVNIWDDPKNVEPFMKDKGGNDKMQYTVAIEEKYEGKEVRNGKMSAEWMTAAGQNGIPSAFIVDKTGTIAWIGHPMGMDQPLKEIVAGTWDVKAAAEAAKIAPEFEAAIEAGKIAEACAIAKKAAAGPAAKDATLMNTLAWTLVDPDTNLSNVDYDAALACAEAAHRATEGKDAMILDTYATCLFKKGQIDKAIEMQAKAVELADARIKKELEARLEEFRNAKK